MNHRIPVLLDGDPGHDDAIAWMLAATGLDIRGVSSAAGNQTIEKTTRNALRICTLLGIRAPVAMGLARPLLSEALTASANNTFGFAAATSLSSSLMRWSRCRIVLCATSTAFAIISASVMFSLPAM